MPPPDCRKSNNANPENAILPQLDTLWPRYGFSNHWIKYAVTFWIPNLISSSSCNDALPIKIWWKSINAYSTYHKETDTIGHKNKLPPGLKHRRRHFKNYKSCPVMPIPHINVRYSLRALTPFVGCQNGILLVKRIDWSNQTGSSLETSASLHRLQIKVPIKNQCVCQTVTLTSYSLANKQQQHKRFLIDWLIRCCKDKILNSLKVHGTITRQS